ncbi:MAG: RluA family pseudouridine synthase [Candidatus Omnitrophota bacterium]
MNEARSPLPRPGRSLPGLFRWPSALTPRIVFEDVHLAVLSKPSGLLSQGGDGSGPDLVTWLRGHFGRHYVGLIHRLDRNVSGLMVVAKRSKAAARLTAALQAGTLERRYQAWIEGHLAREATWRHALLKHEESNKAEVVPPSTPFSKMAVLSVRPVRFAGSKARPLTLAEFRLETGRSHQIRVQSAHEGFPVLGDPKYGRRRMNMKSGAPIALHSSFLRFPHPMSGAFLEFLEPIEDLSAGA